MPWSGLRIFLPSSCFPSSCLPSYFPPIIPSCCLAASCFLFYVSRPCVSHHYLSYPFAICLSYLPSPLHLVSVHVASHCFVSRYLFILSLIIPSSCLSLSLHLVPSSCRCQCFLTMCWVWSKVFWLLLLLGCKAGLYNCSSLCSCSCAPFILEKSHSPARDQGGFEPKGGGPPLLL